MLILGLFPVEINGTVLALYNFKDKIFNKDFDVLKKFW